MTTDHLASPELLRKFLRYEPDTGKLFWLPRTCEFFASAKSCATWNTRFSGTEGFTAVCTSGYWQGSILGRKYLGHRVAWALQTGEWPTEWIDHVDRDRKNNRWKNLREATRSENASNTPSKKGSSSKYLGVSWHKKTGKWRSDIGKGRCTSFLGGFPCEIEAAKAYDAAARALHGDFANLNFQSPELTAPKHSLFDISGSSPTGLR